MYIYVHFFFIWKVIFLLIEGTRLSHWGGILLHRDQKVELGSYRAADPSSIDDQFVFVYSTRWRREIQLSDQKFQTFLSHLKL